MLTEQQLEELTARYGKIGSVEYSGHQVVFRRPTRENCREYRRMRESDTERHEAMERLAQVTLVAFDGELDVNKARTLYTNVFLEEFPLFVNVVRVTTLIASLAGLVEEEDAKDLGKGVHVRSARHPTTQTA